MPAEKTKVVFKISPEAKKHLAEIARSAYGRADTEAYRNLLLLISLMDTLAKSEEPRVLELGSLEISNRAHRERSLRTATAAPIELPPATTGNDDDSLVHKIWNSVELKPGVAGLRIDLKKFLKLPKGW